MKKLIFFILVFFACSSFAADNIISLSNGSGLPGSTKNIVTLYIQNTDTVRGLSATIYDKTDVLTVDSLSVVSVEDTSKLKKNVIDTGVKIIFIGSKSELILPNKGGLINIYYSVSPEAVAGQVFKLEFNEVTLSNKDNQKLSFITRDGKFFIKDVTGINSGHNTVMTYQLAQNYPNPFNPQTRIDYTVPSTQHVLLTIYNSLGQKVKGLIDQAVPAGNHTVHWNGLNENGKSVPAGVYFYRIRAGDFENTKQLTLIR